MAGRVRSLIAADQVREAVEEGRRYGASAAAPPEARAAFGEALYRAGRLRDAEGALAVLAAPDALPSPSRALRTLGLVRIAEGREGEGAALLLRALESRPDDRAIVLSAAGAAPTRARAAELLSRYLDLSSGDDADRIEGARNVEALSSPRRTSRVGREVPPRQGRDPALPAPGPIGSAQRLRDRDGSTLTEADPSPSRLGERRPLSRPSHRRALRSEPALRGDGLRRRRRWFQRGRRGLRGRRRLGELVTR